MSNIIRIVESLEKSRLLIDGATETIKQEIKKAEGGFLGAMMAPMSASLIQLVAPSLIKAMTVKGQEEGFVLLLALPLMMKVLGKVVRRAGRGYNNTDRTFIPTPPFNQYRD